MKTFKQLVKEANETGLSMAKRGDILKVTVEGDKEVSSKFVTVQFSGNNIKDSQGNYWTASGDLKKADSGSELYKYSTNKNYRIFAELVDKKEAIKIVKERIGKLLDRGIFGEVELKFIKYYVSVLESIVSGERDAEQVKDAGVE